MVVVSNCGKRSKPTVAAASFLVRGMEVVLRSFGMKRLFGSDEAERMFNVHTLWLIGSCC